MKRLIAGTFLSLGILGGVPAIAQAEPITTPGFLPVRATVDPDRPQDATACAPTSPLDAQPLSCDTIN